MMTSSRLARFLLLFILSGAALHGFLTKAHAQDTTPPTVVSTYPASGATNVSGKTRIVSITFSEPMRSNVNFNSNWGITTMITGLDLSWSGDQRILYVTRKDTAAVPDNELITFALNAGESENPFADLAGNKLARYDFSFTIGPDGTPPTVVLTYPANGATGIDPYIATVVVTFSEAMVEDFSIQNSGSWGESSLSASPDKRVMYMTRMNAGIPLTAGETIWMTLNPAGSYRFRDLAGNYLQEYTFTFTIGTAGTPPTVVSTSPPNGATNVILDLASVSMTFDKAMKGGYSINSNFPAYGVSWSADQRTITLLRNDLSTPLLAGTNYFFILNKDGTTSFQDLSGVPLREYTFSFTTAANYQLLKIPENPAKGFKWPYYLSIPNSLGHRTALFVMPNNTGGVGDEWAIHDEAALNLTKWWSSFAVDLDAPLLVPTFPRPIGITSNPPLWKTYTHALDRDCLTTTAEGLERIDLQLIAMVNDARERLTGMGYAPAEKIFINGYSASGSFANRFTLLHPEVIQAAASGSPGGWPTVPVSTWSNETLNYPVGIADLQSLVGQPFNVNAFRAVPQYIYVGSIDSNDAVDYEDGFDDVDRDIINKLFGDGSPYIVERWPHAEAIFNSVQSSAQFVIYPGVGHTITSQMSADLLQFFSAYHPAKISLPQAIQALQIAAGVELQGAPSVADINGDGKIGIEEAIYILQRVAGLR